MASFQLDGDRAKELGVWSSGENRLQCFDFVKGTLVTLPILQPPIAKGRHSFWTSGDVDGDGDEDVIVFELPSGSKSTKVHVFRRTGATSFRLEAPYVGGPAASLADVDGDGDLDGVCCGGGGGSSNPAWPKLDFGSQFQIAINDGKGGFATAFGIPSKGARRLAGVADVDGDGDADLVAGACVYYARGPLRASPTLVTGLGWAWPGSANYARALLDLDRDGDVDFVPGLGDALVNQADGRFVRVTAPSPNPVIPKGFT